MNRFGRRAQELWMALAPTAYAQIPDPSLHFSRLGQEAEKAWIDLADQLTGPDVPGEGYFGKVGRINAARMQAEELIQADWLTPPAEVMDPDPDNDEWSKPDQGSSRRMAVWMGEDPMRWRVTGAASLLEALETEHGITLQVLGWTLEEFQAETAPL